eukprot:CAMPEP_0174695526 /NCGR_PEP_ID=MMETSP1094-20130205/1888_1 /TAXON_ID=156173 /ORGANISM="Chrysochromulina brevifilum, Strain UTEX LB 985" /LENGTH=45 /DNA_ID= /DNA_START= /DNA_END= /DNA_ORIENTATION=
MAALMVGGACGGVDLRDGQAAADSLFSCGLMVEHYASAMHRYLKK